MGDIPTGEFAFEKGVLRLISGPEITYRQLRKFQQLLEEAKRGQVNVRELESRVAREAPEFTPFIKALRKFGPPSAAWIISTSLGVASLVATMKAPAPLTEDQMARAVQRGIEQSLNVVTRPAPVLSEERPSDPKVDRHDSDRSDRVNNGQSDHQQAQNDVRDESGHTDD